MFTKPIRHTVLTSLEEVVRFSERYYDGNPHDSYVRCQNNGQIAFTDERGNLYVTPYRCEIHDILEEAGIKEGSLFVPYSATSEGRSVHYQWLIKIAEEENWNGTYEKAYQLAQAKGIMPVTIPGKGYQVREIKFYEDKERRMYFSAMACIYLLEEDSRNNIGTYIIIDEKTVMVCDEYGRTFLITVKGSINDIVNTLLDSGYTRAVNPDRYIYKMPDPPEEEPKNLENVSLE